MSQKFGTIQISDELPCEVLPPKAQSANFSAEEESFFNAGLALATADEEPDVFDDLAGRQPAPRPRIKGLIGDGARRMVGFVVSLWSRTCAAFAQVGHALVALVISLWSQARLVLAVRVGFLTYFAAAWGTRRSPAEQVSRCRAVRPVERTARHPESLLVP